MTTLGAALFDRGHSGFLYLTLGYQERPTDLQFLLDDRHLMIKSAELGQYGSYLIYEAAIGEHESTGKRSWDVHSAHPSVVLVAAATDPTGARPFPLVGTISVGRMESRSGE